MVRLSMRIKGKLNKKRCTTQPYWRRTEPGRGDKTTHTRTDKSAAHTQSYYKRKSFVLQ